MIEKRFFNYFSWIFKDFLVFLHPKRIQNNPITKQNMVKITRINTNRSGKSAVTASSLVKLMDRMTLVIVHSEG